MGAIEKTEALIRKSVPIGQLVKNKNNPNKMSKRAFDLLCDNFQKTGLTDAILVRPMEDEDGEPRYRIVGGHHRYDAAQYLGFEDVPICVITDENFDEDQEKFQLVRMNMIRGKMDPQAFFNLYQQLSNEYADEILQDAFGFAETAEFQRLIDQTAKTLPDEKMQKKFKEAAQEIKTVDGLSHLLNHMFTKYGDTLPYGYMVVDYGGKQSYWLRVEQKTMAAMDVLADICIERQRTMDQLLGGLVQSIAKGELNDLVEKLVLKTPQVVLPVNMTLSPTFENIAKVESVA